MYKSWQDASDARAQSQRRYDKENTVQVSLKLNKKTDADIISWLQRQPSRQAAIKAAIRSTFQE